MVEVELDDNWIVTHLKYLFKAKYAHRLAHVDARDLIVWKCSIPCGDPNLQETLNAIH